jgi:signal transduction histidine kinase
MWPLGYLAQRQAVGTSDNPPAGAAITTLWAVTARTAYLIRCIAIAYVAGQVLIWRSFYAGAPWRLAGPVAAAAWGVAVVAYLMWRRPGWQLACLDSSFLVALALSAGWWVPAAMRGDTANWVYIMLAGQLVVPAWFAPVAVFAPLALASAAAYWAGAAVTEAAGPANSSPAAASALLLATAAAVWAGRWTFYRWAVRADGALGRADLDSREQYVVLSRNIERREHERLLHDTVLNTLTALTRAGGDAAGAVSRCAHDVALMESVLSAPGAPGAAAGLPYGGLLTGIGAVADQMRARGLDVHLDITGDTPAGDGGTAGDCAGAVPSPVAAAMTHAVREALTNVVTHARTGTAWVEVNLAPDGMQVTVRDAGAGFDPAIVDPARLGLQRSIIERTADWGGQASVWSAPGEGTVVSLRWPGPGPGHAGQDAVTAVTAVTAAAAGAPGPPW